MRTYRVKWLAPWLALGMVTWAVGCSKATDPGTTGGSGSGGTGSSTGSTGSQCTGVADCSKPGCAGASCDDGDPCTRNDACATGGCAGTAVTCDDGDACTSDACLAADGGCAHQVVTCDDSDPCTHDTCDAASGCAHAPAADGTPCGSGQLCLGGHCGNGCEILGAAYAADAVNPSNPCQSCQPGTSTTSWTAKADGLACDDGNACTSGDQCASGLCVGAAVSCDDSRACTDDSCDPASGCAHTVKADGTSCSTGHICSNGACDAKCDIAGTIYAYGDLNPNNPCESCDPTNSTSAWTALTSGGCDDGNACTKNDQCVNGACVGTSYTCYAGGGCQGPSTCDGTGACISQPLPDGTACSTGGGNYCHQGACEFGCYINSTFYEFEATNPASKCQVCVPGHSYTDWFNLASGTDCGPNNAACALCNGAGQCVSQCGGGPGPNVEICCANGSCGSLGDCGPGNQ